MPDDRRNPHRPFDPALIRGFLGDRQIVTAQLFPSGKSNTNYQLTLSDGTCCVLRLHSGGHAARENHILTLVNGIVPVPAIIARGQDWTILSFIEGEPLTSAPGQTRAAANALAKIHTIKFDATGWIEPGGAITPFDFGGGRDFVTAMLERPDVQRWLGKEIIVGLLDMHAAETRRHRTEVEPPVLVHGDFNPTNILMRGGAVSGILDWEFAHAGGRYLDIGNLLRHTEPARHDEIRDGLAAGGMALPADWKERAEWVDLGSHLEFLTTRRSAAFKRQCVDWIRGFVGRYGEA